MKIKHQWKFDFPWHMASLKDWFYMVNNGSIEPVVFLHVRIFGIRSLWTIAPNTNGVMEQWINKLTE